MQRHEAGEGTSASIKGGVMQLGNQLHNSWSNHYNPNNEGLATMAVQHLIEQMNAEGIPATLELPGGMWCHSPEYIARRYRGKVRKVKPMDTPKVGNGKLDELIHKMENAKLTPAERALLLAMLEDK